MTDPIAERVRKVGGTTLKSIGHIARTQRVLDNDADYVTPLDMLAELRGDNMEMATHMRAVHAVCDDHNDVATASLLEVWIDETERRAWFLLKPASPAKPRDRLRVAVQPAGRNRGTRGGRAARPPEVGSPGARRTACVRYRT